MKFFGKEFTAAIFDMDGTMFDTERLRFKTLKKASKELFNEEISDELLYDSLGVSAVTAENLAKNRITSYNVCYTKLLRVFYILWFAYYITLKVIEGNCEGFFLI